MDAAASPRMGDPQLDTLEAKGLIRVATLRPELEYLFRHWLVQDAAYGSLLKQERRELHRVVGNALEDLYPERRPELAAVLALHFEQAGDSPRALDYLLQAGSFALERNAIQEGRSLFDRAAGLLPPPAEPDSPELRHKRVLVALGRVKAGWTFSPLDEEIGILAAVADEVETIDDLPLQAEFHLYLALLRQYSGERYETSPALRRSLDRATEIGEQIGDPSIRAMPLALVGLLNVYTGDVRGGIVALEEATPLLEQRNDFVGASFARGALAAGYARVGEFAKAEEAARRATELAENGDLVAQLDALIASATTRTVEGRLEEAIPLAQRCTALAEQMGATACLVASNLVLGEAYLRSGRLLEAESALKRSSDVSQVAMRPLMRPLAEGLLSSTLARLGDLATARRGWEQALPEARAGRHRLAEAAILWQQAEAAAREPDGDLGAAFADFAASAMIYEEVGARPYLARVLRSWGEALRAAGRDEEGSAKLREASAMFEQMGLDSEAAEARSLLGEPSRPEAS